MRRGFASIVGLYVPRARLQLRIGQSGVVEWWSIGALGLKSCWSIEGDGNEAKEQKSGVPAAQGLARCYRAVQGNQSTARTLAFRNETDRRAGNGFRRLCSQKHCRGVLPAIHPGIYPLPL